MGSSKEYRAVKNFFHNTEKIDRHEIKCLLREAIKEILAEEIDRMMQTCSFRMVVSEIARGKEFAIQQAVAKEILSNYDINVTRKGAKP